jgi:hypothetical protein
MSTLVVILAAAMAVPGIGPEAVSGEMERGLDLSGKWEGTWLQLDWQVPVERANLDEGKLVTSHGPWHSRFDLTATDEGKGRLRLRLSEWNCLGIYEFHDDGIRICFRSADQGYPSSFQVDKGGQRLLILHRVKPRK